jgi:TRAP-type C4-dicarboxylate transport system permease small subunit
LIDVIYGWTLKISRVLVGILFTAMVLVVFANVIGRYYLDTSLAWSEEVSRFMLVWLVFLGAVLAYEKDEHLGLDILVKKLPRKVGAVVGIATDLMVIFAIGLIVYGGYRMAVDSWDWESTTVPIPLGYVYVIVPVCGSIMVLQTLLKMCKHIKALRGVEGV